MNKVLPVIFFLLGFYLQAKADHITGGEMYYSFGGVVNGQNQYNGVIKFYKDCKSSRQLVNQVTLSVFDKVSGVRIQDVVVTVSQRETITLNNPSKCITNPPNVCYEIGYYDFSVILPPSANGYTLACQVVYRVSGIGNLVTGYSMIGATYTAEIPSTEVSGATQNNSAKFVGSDLVVVCANNSFNYSFEAVDRDGDELRYSFCNAYQGGTFNNTNSNLPPASPPYMSVPYGNGFVGSQPLGNKVQINAKTGLITGIAPNEGIYVVTVCVQEVRAGKVIATQRKDLQINITPCNVAAAVLQPEYMLCKDTKSINVFNESNSPLINTYNWELYNNKGESIYATNNTNVNFTFPDTGVYSIKLIINQNEDCTDSATAKAIVYPGFKPDFLATGICFTKPTVFNDVSTSQYGKVNSWEWNFGESTTTLDFSDNKNAVYTYPQLGYKNVQLIATDSKGCRDTVFKPIAIVEKPPIDLMFADTLICNKDDVMLKASGAGVVDWYLGNNLIASNTNSIRVAPAFNTVYSVRLNSDGCLNNDSVRVRVTDKVNLSIMNDTTICQGDAITLRIQSDGFKYTWSPASNMDDAFAKTPLATTLVTTTYQVTAAIGTCTATDDVVVKTVPYPVANAGRDTTICFNTEARLNGNITGNNFVWSPVEGLSNTNTLNPATSLTATTSFVLAAFDNKGCTKPGIDTVVVNVLPKIKAYAGNDTAVILGQPLQLEASGGIAYAWQPATGLNNAAIANPIANYTSPVDLLKYKVLVFNEAGCRDSAYVTVRAYKSGPTVFVPTAFSPNGDGVNDVARPIAVGMQQINEFTIFNRWGQRVFTTNINGRGWDGNLAGKPQASDAYIWVARTVDYNGKYYVQKGTIVLIR